MAAIDKVMDGFFTIKGFSLFLRTGRFLTFLARPFLFISNYLSLTNFIARNNDKSIMNDFVVATRKRGVRDEYYQYIAQTHQLENDNIAYLEFGVYKGSSIKWWAAHNTNVSSHFFGFDTFEGLPEAWGPYAKGGMKAAMPQTDDDRVQFIKGLFQQTLYHFIDSNNDHLSKRLIINLDADLFSATIFVLASLGKFLKKGDIILFDEFNVPNHEYFAFKIFTDCFPVKLKLIATRLNFYHAAFIVE